jgi:hypothetical protein
MHAQAMLDTTGVGAEDLAQSLPVHSLLRTYEDYTNSTVKTKVSRFATSATQNIFTPLFLSPPCLFSTFHPPATEREGDVCEAAGPAAADDSREGFCPGREACYRQEPNGLLRRWSVRHPL